MIPSTVVGKYTGNGAAQNIILGFKPDFVLLVNVTDGDIAAIWVRGAHADGTATDIAAAAAPNAADGISAYAGTSGEGFTIGTDYSEAAKVFGYLAIRSGPGAS
jgi:hypothetical protein